MDPRVIFKTGSLDPSFPPGLRLKKPSFSLKERPESPFFEARELTVAPEMGALLTGDVNWFFDAGAYGGVIDGRVLSGKDGKIGGFSLSLTNVRLQEYALLTDFGIGHVAGKLTGNLNYNGSLGRIDTGAGTGDLHISEGRINLSTPFLGLETVFFGELKARFTLKKATVNLSSVSLDAKGFQGSLSGTIYLNRIMGLSRLNLKGTIEPMAAYLETLKGGPALLSLLGGGQNGSKRSFVIQGTFRSPIFRFI
jgi:type II secretion system protein N